MIQSDKHSEYILLGKISGVHGIKGWVKVFSYTNPRVGITNYRTWFLCKNGEYRKVDIKGTKKLGKTLITSVAGVDDRDQAQALIGTEIAIHRDQLKSLAKDQYYWKDLIGLDVETQQGYQLGIVDWIFDTGSNDVIVVKQELGVETKERLLPFVMNDVIKQVDLINSKIVVDWDPEF